MPHIQGLRAIAVLLVVIYHFWPGRLSGGYIGVDVFFVISGFLITGQLARELDRSGHIKLPSFYAKRVRRLLPAAITVLLFSTIATLALLPLSALGANLREIIASTFYVENWALAAGAVDYLAAANEATTVQHYWSLSLEEQFYLVWPVMMLGAAWLGVKYFGGGRIKAMITVVVVVSIISLALSIVMTQVNPSQAYFVTYTRVWEFGFGAILALLPRLRPIKAWQSNILGYGGIIAILGAGYLFDKTTPFPGYMALIPVLGTAAVLIAHHRDKPWDAGRVLSTRPAVFIGDISYSLYLWHWPLIVIAPYVPGWGLSFAHRVALLAICFVLAWLTKKFIEDPTRSWNFLTSRKPRVTFGFMVAAMALTTLAVVGTSLVQQPKYDQAASELEATLAELPECFGAAGGASDGLGTPLNCTNAELEGQIIPSPGFGNADRPVHPECLTTLNDSSLIECTFGSQQADAPTVALIGDSHAYALMDPIVELAEQNGWALTTYLKGGCAWSTTPLAARDAFAQSCDQWRASLEKTLTEGEGFDVIFTAALADRSVDAESAADYSAGFAEAFSTVASKGTHIVSIVDNPAWEDDPNKCLRTSAPADCTVPRDEGLAEFDPMTQAAAAASASDQRVSVLDFSDTYCDAEECASVIAGANVYRDQDHLTRTFAFTLAPFIGAAITAALAQ